MLFKTNTRKVFTNNNKICNNNEIKQCIVNHKGFRFFYCSVKWCSVNGAPYSVFYK